jgi:hypothetical protein
MTTAAAIDRLVHHSTILELTGTSFRNEAAKSKKGNDHYKKPAEATGKGGKHE